MDRPQEQKTNLVQSNKSSKPIIPIFSIPTNRVQNTHQMHNKNNFDNELERYKRDYLHLLQENQLLEAHLAKVIREKDQLQKKFHNIHVNPHSDKSGTEEKKKRQRRIASEIIRDYLCPLDKCGKTYGTDASLVQHIKIKHSDYFTSSQYQQFINSLRKRKNIQKNDEQEDRTPLGSVCLEFNK